MLGFFLFLIGAGFVVYLILLARLSYTEGQNVGLTNRLLKDEVARRAKEAAQQKQEQGK